MRQKLILLNAVNAAGQPTNINTGTLSRTYGFDAYGYPTGRAAGNIQNFQYQFNPQKGNLTYRKDNSRNLQENFEYDNLNRLKVYPGGPAEYDTQGKGNLVKRNEIGNTLLQPEPQQVQLCVE